MKPARPLMKSVIYQLAAEKALMRRSSEVEVEDLLIALISRSATTRRVLTEKGLDPDHVATIAGFALVGDRTDHVPRPSRELVNALEHARNLSHPQSIALLAGVLNSTSFITDYLEMNGITADTTIPHALTLYNALELENA